MSGLPKNVQQWLRKTPRPATIVADDKPIAVPTGGRAWKELATTLEAINPTKLIAMDAAGTIIRSIMVEGSDEDDKHSSPEMSDVQLFAKLISEAYDKGNKMNQPLLDNCLNMIDRQAQTIQKQSSEIDKLRFTIHKMQAEILELTAQPGDEDGGVLGALAQGMAMAEANKGGNVKSIVKKRADES